MDRIFLGWYHICDKTIYANDADRTGIGPKEHAFFITYLAHGINLWTLVSYLLATYRGIVTPLYLSLGIGLTVFVAGYFGFFRKRADDVIARTVKKSTLIVCAILAVVYVVICAWGMLEVGNYVREIVP